MINNFYVVWFILNIPYLCISTVREVCLFGSRLMLLCASFAVYMLPPVIGMFTNVCTHIAMFNLQ